MSMFTKGEWNKLYENHIESLRIEAKEELLKSNPQIKAFTNFCCKIGISLDKSNFKYCRAIGVYVEYPNILRSFMGSPNKESLYLVNECENKYILRQEFAGYYFAANYVVMAHPYFRRDFSECAGFAPLFIKEYWECNDPQIDKYIALDNNRIRIDVERGSYQERDVWYGAPFNKNISMIKSGTVSLKPPDDFKDDIDFNGLLRLDIKWTQSERIKEFEAEEIKCGDVIIIQDGETYYPARYIHSEYDLSTGAYRHLDGAVHLYSQEEYEIRKELDLNFNNKDNRQLKPKSTKLFKMNGQLSMKTWSEFVCQFLYGDYEIIRYFDGFYPNNIQHMLDVERHNRNKQL